jgi:hypothetical protein
MTGTALALVKFALAVVACAFLARDVLAGRSSRLARRVLWASALAAAAVFFAPGLQRSEFIHRWEMFHYYLGSKYHAELGYERLYDCVAVADDADGLRKVRTRRIRDLTTDRLTTPARALDDPSACRAHFAPARWDAFRSDVRTLRRGTSSRKLWEGMQRDHGYNPPPLWTLTGRSLASLAPPTAEFLTLLALLDVLLMAGSVALVGWAFGSRIALLSVIFWGTQAPSEFGWTGGGFLRQDWLFFVIAALSLSRKGRPFWAGAALATAALLRLFPVLLFAGPLALALAALLRQKLPSASQRRFFAGAAAGFVLLGLASGFGVGFSAYPSFWEHIQLRHTSAITNHMSLRTLFAFAPDARLSELFDPTRLDPVSTWAAARATRLAAVGWLYQGGAIALLLVTLLVGFRLRTGWMAMALSVPLIPALTDPSCYYYSVWVATLVLARARPALGVTLLGVAAAGQLLTLGVRADEERYFALAALYVLSGTVLTLSFAEPLGASFRRIRAGFTRRGAVSFDMRSTT